MQEHLYTVFRRELAMKTKYVVAKAFVDVKPVLKKALPLLKGKIGIVTTVQFLHLMKEAKQFLDEHNINSTILGQVLGCNIEVTKNSDADSFLYIGDGLFHPKGLIVQKERHVIMADPLSNKVRELTKEEIKRFENIRYKGQVTFHSSKNIGVLVSLKPGQEHLVAGLTLKKKYPDKNFYILVFDDLNFASLEDFPFIECYVNTMCQRISYDDVNKLPRAVVDYSDLQ
ncbi:TPA: hypothetical protein HA219_03745 [Candidatus Woesearchaeota archaeon]|nr:diphthamide synthesis protein [Candidatus Woesearchaeota archaeon]HIH39804.1 hypothetical protein [Candidatus Woesearchaeota archaeon]